MGDEICIDPVNATSLPDYIREKTAVQREINEKVISEDKDPEAMREAFAMSFHSLDDLDQFATKIEKLMDDMANGKRPWGDICIKLVERKIGT